MAANNQRKRIEDSGKVNGETLLGKASGFNGIIKALSGDSFIVARLLELGFVRGERVILRGRAPFGDPFFLEVRGTLVALREEEVLCIRL